MDCFIEAIASLLAVKRLRSKLGQHLFPKKYILRLRMKMAQFFVV